MKESVSFCDFQDRFTAMGREYNFSYQGKKALFEYLEMLEEDCGIEIELDVIEICCIYSEDLIEDFGATYGIEGDNEDILTELRNNTTVIEVDGDSIIIEDY